MKSLGKALNEGWITPVEKSLLTEIWGKWPRDETTEALLAMLDERKSWRWDDRWLHGDIYFLNMDELKLWRHSGDPYD